MLQQGQVFELATRGSDGNPLWAYRFRAGGRDSRRVQRGGFRAEADARASLERALEKLRRESGVGRRPTLAEFVDEYLAQHEVSPVTLEKLRFLLTRAVRAFGGHYLDELDPVEISAWRMTVPPGYRFEATQALRQVLARAVVWGMLDVNPAKQGVENPQRRRTEKRPFEPWGELEALAERLGRGWDQWCSLPLQPECARASGSRSSAATSTGKHKSRTSVARSARAVSPIQRPRRASAPCRYRLVPLRRSISYSRVLLASFF